VLQQEHVVLIEVVVVLLGQLVQVGVVGLMVFHRQRLS
jgi:hypothetical protein